MMESKGSLSEINNQEKICAEKQTIQVLEQENARLLKSLAQKEDQNKIILSISHAIASVRHKLDLFDVIDQKLKKLFDFDHFVICLINSDQQTHSPFIYNQKEDFLKTAGIPPKASKKYPLEDGMCRAMIASTDPIVFDVDEVMQWPDAPAWLGFWQNKGIKEMIGLRMTDSSGCIGFFYIYTQHRKTVSNIYFDLLQGISLQISIAISNILANEKIEQQLDEINTYKLKLEEEKSYLKEEISQKYNHTEIIGESAMLKKVFHLIDQVATSSSTVLILGETGTGKELIARAIHNASARNKALMVKINCAALPAGLAESELFGHEKGSFTGALDRRIGKFELAHNGTLFLDEIGELSLDLQVKLLRALQEKEIERIGGRQTIKTDVRIIAATNRDLYQEVAKGNFRSDLYYRLNVFPIHIPSLKERTEDIPALVAHFIDKIGKKTGRNVHAISKSSMNKLLQYPWPGNVRELEHLIERSILLCHGTVLKDIHLPKIEQVDTGAYGTPQKIKTIHENERDHILSILKSCKGKISGKNGAAEILRIPPTTLNSKIKKLGIKRAHILEK
ncbi:sigma 54-interacting transcriptional regulator [Pedobacter sp.]|uniref:sigma-54-dependent Fis family transcriptional regulator n=1 Tax=Pedobacter sp. TaxID=1411316 RepID=UPI0031D3ED41